MTLDPHPMSLVVSKKLANDYVLLLTLPVCYFEFKKYSENTAMTLLPLLISQSLLSNYVLKKALPGGNPKLNLS